MKITDRMNNRNMLGVVRGIWINHTTGEQRDAFTIRNQLTYGCADVLARLMGGQTEYLPRHMGFIYGTDAAPTLYGLGNRDQSWAGLATELAGVTKANIQIVPISLTPSISLDNNDPMYGSGTYTGNKVTLTAMTSPAGVLGFEGTTYADALATGNKLYNAMLLTRLQDSTGYRYIPVARVTLAQENIYPAKPDGFELALLWSISFF